MARPRKVEKYVHKTFKLPKELAERLDGYVEKITANRSLIVRMAILEYLDIHAPNKDNPLPSRRTPTRFSRKPKKS